MIATVGIMSGCALESRCDGCAEYLCVSRTVSGVDGKSYVVDGADEAVELPGAGPASKFIAVYGNSTHKWYIDKEGQQVDLPVQGHSVPVYKVFPRFRDYKEDPLPLNTRIRWNQDGQAFYYNESSDEARTTIIPDSDSWGSWLSGCHRPQFWVHKPARTDATVGGK